MITFVFLNFHPSFNKSPIPQRFPVSKASLYVATCVNKELAALYLAAYTIANIYTIINK